VITVAVVLIAFIGVTAVKIARRQQLEQQAIEKTAKRALEPVELRAAEPTAPDAQTENETKQGAGA
ncbi:MAG: hypothetical protein AAGH64_07060, partial [Planctomycetota bacterium]